MLSPAAGGQGVVVGQAEEHEGRRPAFGSVLGLRAVGAPSVEERPKLFRPDLQNPGPDDLKLAAQFMHVLPVGWVEPVDISNAVLLLASDEARFVTGLPVTVDAGSMLK